MQHIPASNITLGILAGGRASRLGGIDKAWLHRGDGSTQVERLSRRFANEHGPVLVSANRDLDRYAPLGLRVVKDRHRDIGPVGGLDALAQVCETEWLFTLPVDVVGVNDCLLRTLRAECANDGAFAADDDGLQPLIALWRRDALRTACAMAVENNEAAVHRLADGMTMAVVTFVGFRFGNLNTPDDLRSAGFDAQAAIAP